MPRTATTVVQQVVAEHFDLPNIGEIGSDQNHSDTDSSKNVEILGSHTRWCAKFLSQTNVSNNLIDFWQTNEVDLVIVTRRKHLADAICSMHLARVIGRLHHDEPVKFVDGWRCYISESIVEYWIYHLYQPFLQTCRLLERTKIPVTTVLKEDFELNFTITIGDALVSGDQDCRNYLQFRIDYPTLVSNYDQIRSATAQFDRT